RETNRNPIGTFKKLAPDTPWWLVGALGVLTGFVILSFYSVVSGWGIAYFFKGLFGELGDGADFEAVFGSHISSTWTPIIWHFVFMALTVMIVGMGIVKGIGRAVKYLMPVLFVLILILVVRSVTLEGAAEGLRFYLYPDFSEITWKTWLEAAGQAFFTLSLGMGAIITYGSYLKKDDDIPSSASWIIVLDLSIAILAGFAIFPAVFALGFSESDGAGLAFITLPAVFAQIPFGQLFGAIFFLFFTFAALTSALSLLEVVVSWLVDEKNMSRVKATVIVGGLIFLLGIPSSLSMGAVEITVLGKSFFDFLDYLQQTFLLPIGGLLTLVFAAYVFKATKMRESANHGASHFTLGRWYEVLIKYVTPAVILIILVFGIFS
ncbi:MAG: sodium-dependent transporter, partial [Bacillota bacterium]